MSFNQSRSDKNDTNASQYRKSGRSASFNQHRSSSSSTAYVSKGSGPPPAGPASANPHSSSNRSSKKSNNVQGPQSSRVNSQPTVNYSDSVHSSASRNLQNGAHVQPPSQGRVDQTKSKGASAASVQNEVQKSAEAAVAQRNSRATSKPPTAQSVSSSSDHAAPKTPVNAPEESSKTFAFQFGSISPGFMNGMQIPARTSSAPPNLDEQKRDQARANAHKVASSLPTPSPPSASPAPKHPLSRKDAAAADQSNTGESNQVHKVKKDAQVPPAPTVSQTQKPPVLPIPIASMQMPFHQQQVPVHYGGPNPQMQPQGVPASSLQMPMHMPLAMANAPQPLFVPPHQVQPQGMLHQSQVSYTAQMGPRMPTQIGTSQYPQQQGGKFGGPRKTVKITDPKTHEELRLDYADGGSTGLRSHPNLPPQSQPIPSFAQTHPMYYRNSYNANNVYYPSPGALPVSSSQMAPGAQPPRFNFSVNLGPQNLPYVNPPHLNSVPITKSGTVLHASSESAEHGHDVHNVTPVSSGMTEATGQPSAVSNAVKVTDPPSSSGSNATGGKSSYQKTTRPSAEVNSSQIQTDTKTSKESSLQQQKPTSEKLSSKLPPEATKQSAVIVDSLVSSSLSLSSPSLSEESVPAGRKEEKKTGALSRSNSLKDQHKKPGKEGLVQHQDQGDGQTVSVTSLPLQSFEHGISANGVPENVEDKSSFTPLNREQLSELSNEPVSRVSDMTTGTEAVTGTKIVAVSNSEQDNSFSQEVIKHQIDIQEQRKKQDGNHSGTIFAPTSDSVEQTKQSEDEHSKINQKGSDESLAWHKESNIMDNNETSASQSIDSSYVGKSHGDQLSAPDVFSEVSDDKSGSDAIAEPHATTSVDSVSDTTSALGEGAKNADVSMTTLVLDSKDKPVELARSGSTTVKLKKRMREIYQKADALGTTSDLYTAYKGPEEKKENLVTSETTESLPTHAPPIASKVDPAGQSTQEQVKAEPEDWEDAADIPSPKSTSGNTDKGYGQVLHQDGDGNTAKKYSRDFLLKFSEQCTDLPQGFTISSEIAEVFATGSLREPNPNPGRNMDRSSSGSRLDRRVSGMAEDERWNKMPGPYGMGKDIRFDLGFGGGVGFRPGQGNYGNIRNFRPQAAVPYVGGILPGPMQSMGPQGMIPRTGPDADRWQRGSEFQRGLIPSPHTPMQMMHKAERKYEVGKVTDEEEAKQRQLKAILNKLTPQNFEKLFEQVKAVNIDNFVTLTGVISQIFDKALMEPTFCEMYANFCFHLAGELPDLSQDNEKITFKRLLLNKCQEEFERNEREQEEANKADEEGEIKQSDEEREEKRIKARRRMLGNIRLIGELYKKKMLTERIMHECIKSLLGQSESPDEENVESLCKLMSTIGEIIDHPRAKEHMDAYFEKMTMFSNNMKLSSRVRFMLKDAIDLRKNKWQQRRKVEGPKKIEEVHRDAAQERHLQTSRLARNPSMNPSARRGAMDFGPRGSSMLPSPNAQMGGFRGMASPAMTSPVRGYTQDFRFEESYGVKTFPLAQRIVGDESITLGPQGGLARGMATRGPPASAISPIADGSSQGDSRRVAAGVNNFSGMSERPNYGTREDFMQRNIPDRVALPTGYDQVTAQDRNLNYGHWDSRNLDHGFGRSHAASPSARVQEPELTQNIPSGNVSEEYLRDKSLAAIKEFYSARDEEEVALCIKELNAPSFHPSMISLWVTDSFERKDMERELLAKLLINLARSQDDIFTQAQLVKGFESVLMNLEDAVNDAPRAPEFLGRVFAKAVIENVVSLREIGRLLQEGGEEPGCLVEFGVAGDVLGSTLEGIGVEKGEGALKEVRKSSGLRLEDFRPPDPINRSKILEKFL